MAVLQVNHKEHITCATINRPEAHNAVNFAVIEALENLVDTLENNSNTRCLVLRGAGDETFISGGDLREFHAIKAGAEARPMARRMMSLLERLETLPCWTIACVNGAVYGGGCEIMLGFDFRIATAGATFGFTQGKFYLPPGWGGLTRLVERVGRATALRWLGETAVVDTDTALNHSLIDRVVTTDSLNQETMAWAKRLCTNDRNYIQTLKKGALKLTEARWQAIQEELTPFATFWEDEQHQKRVEKFLNRKKK